MQLSKIIKHVIHNIHIVIFSICAPLLQETDPNDSIINQISYQLQEKVLYTNILITNKTDILCTNILIRNISEYILQKTTTIYHLN